jgi:sirohydrochlorin ferrochelatase
MPGRSAHNPLRHSLAPPATAIIVFAHGSKVPEANDVFERLADEVSRHSGLPSRAAFLEIAEPDLGAAISAAVSEGARRVVIAPAFLTIGRHVSHDLPRLLREQQAAHPRIEILAGQSLEGHPGVAAILLERVSEVLRGEALKDEGLRGEVLGREAPKRSAPGSRAIRKTRGITSSAKLSAKQGESLR